MQYLKRNTKFGILSFLVIVLSITTFISTLAKTEVYFSLCDNPQKAIIKNINQVQAFINIAMYVFPPPARKVITLRDLLSGRFKEPEDLLQLPELLNLNWKEWIQKEIVINIQ